MARGRPATVFVRPLTAHEEQEWQIASIFSTVVTLHYVSSRDPAPHLRSAAIDALETLFQLQPSLITTVFRVDGQEIDGASWRTKSADAAPRRTRTPSFFRVTSQHFGTPGQPLDMVFPRVVAAAMASAQCGRRDLRGTTGDPTVGGCGHDTPALWLVVTTGAVSGLLSSMLGYVILGRPFVRVRVRHDLHVRAEDHWVELYVASRRAVRCLAERKRRSAHG